MFPARRARAVVDFEADAEVVGADETRVEQTAQQWVARSADRVQRPGAVERVGEAHRVRSAGASPADGDVDSVACLLGRDNSSGHDLETALTDPPGDHVRHFGRDAVAMHVPPGARVAQEAALLFDAEALPQRMALRPQTID